MPATIFGISVKREPWDKEAALPRALSRRYRCQKVFLDGIPSVWIQPTEETGTLTQIRKDMERIRLLDPVPVVLELKTVSSYRRKTLLQNRIPFVTQRQCFLPFLGAYLTGETDEPQKVQKLVSSAQMLFLYYLYQNRSELYLSDAAKVLPYSAMTLSRAVKQLEETGLFQTAKDGVRVILHSSYTPRELLAKAECHLSSPVRKTGFAERSALSADMYPAGLSALDGTHDHTLPKVPTYAVYEKKFDSTEMSTELLDPDTQIRLELWAYDPALLVRDGRADIVSVAMSFPDDAEDDIQEAVAGRIKREVCAK